MEARGTSEPFEAEPVTWQPRVMWASGRLLAGAITFFFISFLFAYFYLRSLDLNRNWKIGHNVNPSIGLGIAITLALVVSAVLLRLAARRPALGVPLAAGSLVLALASVALQCVQYMKLGFGGASGGYASVYIGWTSTYAVLTLVCAIMIEIQLATLWRARREGWGVLGPEVAAAGLEGASFFWGYYVLFGVAAFIVLYIL